MRELCARNHFAGDGGTRPFQLQTLSVAAVIVLHDDLVPLPGQHVDRAGVGRGALVSPAVDQQLAVDVYADAVVGRGVEGVGLRSVGLDHPRPGARPFRPHDSRGGRILRAPIVIEIRGDLAGHRRAAETDVVVILGDEPHGALLGIEYPRVLARRTAAPDDHIVVGRERRDRRRGLRPVGGDVDPGLRALRDSIGRVPLAVDAPLTLHVLAEARPGDDEVALCVHGHCRVVAAAGVAEVHREVAAQATAGDPWRTEVDARKREVRRTVDRHMAELGGAKSARVRQRHRQPGEIVAVHVDRHG